MKEKLYKKDVKYGLNNYVYDFIKTKGLDVCKDSYYFLDCIHGLYEKGNKQYNIVYKDLKVYLFYEIYKVCKLRYG